jgi:hypothetical protein
MIKLKEPAKIIIENSILCFNQKERHKEAALLEAFKRYSSYEEILVHCFLLNALYHTRVDDSNLNSIAKRIYDSPTILEIIECCGEGKSETVRVVKKVANFGSKEFVSFASKYCNWICYANRPNIEKSYPIIDRYSRGMVWEIYTTILGKDLSKTAIHEYDCFVEAFEIVYEKYGVDFTYKEFDKYLWWYGRDRGIFID